MILSSLISKCIHECARARPLLEAEEIRRFYESCEMQPVHRDWPHFFRKEIRMATMNGGFVSVNRLKCRLNWRVLKELCIRLLHVYQSALNWARPEMHARVLKYNQ